MSNATTLDATFERIVSDPYVDPRPLYELFREQAPVYRTPFGFWTTWTYDTTLTVLRDPARFTMDPSMTETAHLPNPESFTMQTWARTVVVSDGPAHQRLRQIARPFFTPAAMEQLRHKVDAVVKERLAQFAGRQDLEFRFEFAELLPTRVILALLGISHEHVSLFADVSEALARSFEPDVTAETMEWSDSVWYQAAEIVHATAADRRANPADDLITALVTPQADVGMLTEDELVSMVLVLNVAGQETTGQVMCTGLYHLLRHPDQLGRLRADRSLMPGAIEECLRYDAATRATGPRFAIDDTELGGTSIGAGETIFVMPHSANHDPSQFADPLEFRVDRTPNRHVGFGHGAHHCLGAALARLELGVVWNALLDHYRSIELAEDHLAWKPRFMVRGLELLPLRVAA